MSPDDRSKFVADACREPRASLAEACAVLRERLRVSNSSAMNIRNVKLEPQKNKKDKSLTSGVYGPIEVVKKNGQRYAHFAVAYPVFVQGSNCTAEYKPRYMRTSVYIGSQTTYTFKKEREARVKAEGLRALKLGIYMKEKKVFEAKKLEEERRFLRAYSSNLNSIY